MGCCLHFFFVLPSDQRAEPVQIVGIVQRYNDGVANEEEQTLGANDVVPVSESLQRRS